MVLEKWKLARLTETMMKTILFGFVEIYKILAMKANFSLLTSTLRHGLAYHWCIYTGKITQCMLEVQDVQQLTFAGKGDWVKIHKSASALETPRPIFHE